MEILYIKKKLDILFQFQMQKKVLRNSRKIQIQKLRFLKDFL